MPSVIQLLPDVVANQIAAGEVIQRPASVVKELLENAIDATASKIQLIVKDSGKTLIQVIDNGTGMDEIDARMCFERHATSKVKTADDLFKINTLGFRGEALASIASVARIEIQTRKAEEETGTKIVLHGLDVKSQEVVATPTGTNIAVKTLFYNIPARRKFLKSDAVEFKHILEEFQRIAIPYHDISFSLTHNEKEMFRLSSGSLLQRVHQVLGRNFKEKLVSLNEETDVVKIEGYIGKPEFARKTRGDQFLFINKRFFRSGYLHHAIMGAYENLIGQGLLPSYVIFLEIEPSRIDVNVHPTKQEIKFENERLIYNYLKAAIRHALGRSGVIPSLDFEQDPAIVELIRPKRHESVKDSLSWSGKKEDFRNWEQMYEGIEAGTSAPPSTEIQTIIPNWDDTRQDDKLGSESRSYIQVGQRYILFNKGSGYVLVDQKRAHIRYLYEYFLGMGNNSPATQKLLFPETFHLGHRESATLAEILDELAKIGFDIEAFGSDTFILHGIPEVMDQTSRAIDLIIKLTENFHESHMTDDKLNQVIAANLATEASYHMDRSLKQEEMKQLVDKLFACEEPFRTPSGKACFLEYSFEHLDKMFNT